MSDNLPAGYSREDNAKPPSRREIAAAEREWRALELWWKTGDEGEVRKALRLPSKHAARVLINRAAENYRAQRVQHADRVYGMQNHLLNMAARDLAVRIFENGEVGRYRDLLAVFDRQAKLHDIDEQVQETGGNTYVLSAGGDINMVPPGSQVVDVRMPWERGELVEGEEVQNDNEAP